MLHRSESLLTLWQHHSLGILWCNTKTGLSRNNRQCYGKSYRTTAAWRLQIVVWQNMSFQSNHPE
ncbi:hypothetical protein H7G26_003612 [Escherichia coli]|nr:hypothetical protein [Escherichia coli]